MGFLDFLSKKKHPEQGEGTSKSEGSRKKSPREIARLARLVGEKMAQNYDRQEAIEELAKMGTAEAAEALLRRFSFSMEPSITDQEEKEAAADGIVAAGSAALDAVRAYCAKAESLTWPLKVLRRIIADEAIVDEILGILDQFDTEYMRNPEPKIQLLSVLEEYPTDDVREAVEPFLGDVSEPVRFAAVTTVFAVNDSRSARALVAALEEEESLRIKNRIAGGLAERGWEVPSDLRDLCSRVLPRGFRLDGDRIRGSV
jgi:HEAT repeat protein